MVLPTAFNLFNWSLPNNWSAFQETYTVRDLNSSDVSNNTTNKLKRFPKAFSPYKLNNEDFAELAPLLPFVVILTILFILLLIIGFRRWPGLMAGIIAGCLTSASIYLIMSAIAGDIPLYE